MRMLRLTRLVCCFSGRRVVLALVSCSWTLDWRALPPSRALRYSLCLFSLQSPGSAGKGDNQLFPEQTAFHEAHEKGHAKGAKNAKERDGKPMNFFAKIRTFTLTNPITSVPFINPPRSPGTKGGASQAKSGATANHWIFGLRR